MLAGLSWSCLLSAGLKVAPQCLTGAAFNLSVTTAFGSVKNVPVSLLFEVKVDVGRLRQYNIEIIVSVNIVADLIHL